MGCLFVKMIKIWIREKRKYREKILRGGVIRKSEGYKGVDYFRGMIKKCASATALEVFCLWNVVKSRVVAVANSKIPTTSQE